MRLRHYRSIASCDVVLGDLTLLVGPNGSGKSNFLDSLRLTAQALKENLDNALRERGGISEVRRRSRGHPTHFGISVNFTIDGRRGEYKFQVAAVSGGDFKISREECEIQYDGEEHLEMYDRNLPARKKHFFSIRDGKLTASSEPILPKVQDDRLFLVSASGIDAFREVFDGLSNVNVYNINPDAMRHLQKPESGELLRRDGSNVASVIERLRREAPETKERIEAYLSRVVEGVTGVDRHGYGSWETVIFRQKVAGDAAPWTFQATSMSDGTLRALGVLTALLAGAQDAASPVGIEEPEVALHPAAAGLLLDALRDATLFRQVFITTHSPDLLDSSSISADELLAVRSVNGDTVIGPVDKAGQTALRDSLYTPGELLRTDQLTPERGTPKQLELFS